MKAASRRATVTVYGAERTVYVAPGEALGDVIDRAKAAAIGARFGRSASMTSVIITGQTTGRDLDDVQATHHEGTICGPLIDGRARVLGRLRWTTSSEIWAANLAAVVAAGGVP